MSAWRKPAHVVCPLCGRQLQRQRGSASDAQTLFICGSGACAVSSIAIRWRLLGDVVLGIREQEKTGS
jgi:hypothetical protein